MESQKAEIIRAENEIWGEDVEQYCAMDCGAIAEAGSCYCADCEAKIENN